MNHAQGVRRFLGLCLLAAVLALSSTARAQWIEFVDATASLLDAEQDLIAGDTQEKDYAWGDLDKDGDIDLVVVRKEPFTTLGKEPNVLLINQNGVLTDRTGDFASASDISGDNGFLTPTNDRDVVLVDVDLDGWLDIVIAATLSDTDPKHIGHPRVYRNLGCTGACDGTEDWLGLIHEDARIPQLLTYDGQDNQNPRFCAVSAGDVTGDGYPDLYFSAYESGVLEPMPGPDFNDKLLINLGTANPGFFVDVTDERFSGDVPGINQPLVVSNFGAASALVDLNGDGLDDIVKHSALVFPYYVGVGVNGPGTPGFFDTYSVVNNDAPYFVSAGDLNNDGWPELILTDDGADRYYVNQNNAATAEFISYLFSFSHSGAGGPAGDDGFGGNSLAVDVDNDGWNDVLIADVDVDVPGCTNRLHIYRNLGGTPGGVPVIQEQTSGSQCANFYGNPPACIVAGIPSDKLEGVHDMAVFDINGDGWKDMVVGRCAGTEVYTQTPSGPPAGATPDGMDVPGQQLLVGKSLLPGLITLTWGGSCSLSDDDYAMYEGRLDDIGDHSSLVCSTAGSTIRTLLPDPEDSYYLIVPNNGVAEGSYGWDSNGIPRQRGADACYPQNHGACE